MAFRERNPNSLFVTHRANDTSKLKKEHKDFSRPLPVPSKENDVPTNTSSFNRTLFVKSSQNHDNRRVALTNIHNQDQIFNKGYYQNQIRKGYDGVSVWSDSVPSAFDKHGKNNDIVTPSISPATGSVGHNSCESVSSIDSK
jgi:hypothetical protein